MAKNTPTDGMSAKDLQNALVAKEITPAQAKARAKEMLSREDKGEGFYARWTKVLKACEAKSFAETPMSHFFAKDATAKPKATAKAKPQAKAVAELTPAQVQALLKILNVG